MKTFSVTREYPYLYYNIIVVYNFVHLLFIYVGYEFMIVDPWFITNGG